MSRVVLCSEIVEVDNGWIVKARWPIGCDPSGFGEVVCPTWRDVIAVLDRCSVRNRTRSQQDSALPAREAAECHGCKHWTVYPLAKDFDKPSQYGTCRGMRGCGVEIETTGDCSVDAICTDATFACKGWEAR